MGIIRCKICGKEEDTSRYIEKMANELQNNQMCFTCNHWREQHELDINIRGIYHYAIVKGEHYVLGPDIPGNSFMKGFAGRKFTFKFKD